MTDTEEDSKNINTTDFDLKTELSALVNQNILPTRVAERLEEKLKENFKVDIIPTPREISASCGISIKFDSSDLELILQQIDMNEAKAELYHIQSMNGNKEIRKIKMGDI